MLNNQKRRAIELAHRFKRRYDAQMLQAKIDYMASLHAPCVLAVVGDEVYSYNSRSAAFMAHGFKARYIAIYEKAMIMRENQRFGQMSKDIQYERNVCPVYGMCYHFNENLCKCWHTGTKGEYWIATPLADGTIDLAEVQQ